MVHAMGSKLTKFHTANTKIYTPGMFIWYQYHLIPTPSWSIPLLISSSKVDFDKLKCLTKTNLSREVALLPHPLKQTNSVKL